MSRVTWFGIGMITAWVLLGVLAILVAIAATRHPDRRRHLDRRVAAITADLDAELADLLGSPGTGEQQ